MDKWIKMEDLASYPQVTDEEVKKAMELAVAQVRRNLPEFTDKFPQASSKGIFIHLGKM